MNNYKNLDRASLIAGFALLFTGFYELYKINFYAVGLGVMIALGTFLFNMPKINRNNNKEENKDCR